MNIPPKFQAIVDHLAKRHSGTEAREILPTDQVKVNLDI